MADIEYTTQKGHRIVIHDDGKIDVMGAAAPTEDGVQAPNSFRSSLGPGSEAPPERKAPTMAELRARHAEVDGGNAGPPVQQNDITGMTSPVPRMWNEALQRAFPKPRVDPMEHDPLAQMIVSQAIATPALHVAGLGLSAAGRAIMNTEGGQAARTLARAAEDGPTAAVNPKAVVKSGPYAGQMAEEALAHAKRLEEGGRGMSAAKEQILNDAMQVSEDPVVAAARKKLEWHGPHGGDIAGAGGAGYLLHLMGHGGPTASLPALAMLAARNAAPLAGRVVGPALEAAGPAAVRDLEISRLAGIPAGAGNPITGER